MKTSKEIREELEAINKMLLVNLNHELGIYVIDLEYIAQRVGDLRQELRIAEARER